MHILQMNPSVPHPRFLIRGPTVVCLGYILTDLFLNIYIHLYYTHLYKYSLRAMS